MIENKSSIVFSFTIFCLMLMATTTYAQAQSPDFIYINTQVVDSTSNLPIRNAVVQVWTVPDKSYYSTWQLISVGKTDANGQSSAKVKGGVQYGIYALYDDSSSPGFDGAPAFRLLSPVKENATISFRLIPAMTILFTGELRFIETTKTSTSFTFNIKDNTSSPDSEYVHTFGTIPLCHNFLNLSSKHVIIPIDRNILIEAKADVTAEKQTLSRNFKIDGLEQLNLAKGKLTQISIEKYSLKNDLEMLKNTTTASEKLLKNIEENGFYVSLEKQDLAKIQNLLEIAKNKLDSGQYGESYASLREAYIKNIETDTQLKAVYANASTSVFALIIFLNLTAAVIAYVVSERLIKKGLITILVVSSFFMSLYYSYPGCRLIPTFFILEYLAASLSITFLLTILIPFLLKEKFVSTFSLAKRHLRQRRLRFTLTLLSVTVLVMGFVSLTSFSTGYGLIVKPFYSFSTISNGLLVKQPLLLGSTGLVKFMPIDPSIITYIQKDPNIITTALKAENVPQYLVLGSLSALNESQRSINLFGVIGLQPSVEAEITQIDRIVVEGRYLRDEDRNSILISASAAAELKATTNDKLLLSVGGKRTEVTVVGFFDDGDISTLRDVDGENILPQRIVRIGTGDFIEFRPQSCEPNEIIIAPLEFSLQIPLVKISRINAVPRDDSLSLSIARKIALEKDLWVFYSSGSQHYLTILGSYLEARGTSIIIPWIIVILSVIITMLNSIFEQRREIAILSSIGLNPSHITGLFIAEAAIIGIIGGGVGYLLGLGNYKVMSIFSVVVEVRYKVSAVWSFASILLSLAAVLVGAGVALRFSAVITPSLLRRWSIEEKPPPIGEEWAVKIPLRVKEEDLDSMFNFVLKRIREHLLGRGLEKYFDRIKWFEEETSERRVKSFHFPLIPTRDLVVGSLPFDFVASREKSDDNYSLKIAFKQMYGRDESAYRTTSFLRMTLIEWSSSKK